MMPSDRASGPTVSAKLLATSFMRSSVASPIRYSPATLLCLTRIAADVPAAARVCREKSGQGATFYRVRWDAPTGPDGRRQQRCLYLGTDPGLAACAREILLERRRDETPPPAAEIPMGRLLRLRGLLRHLMPAARKMALAAGFAFHGYRILRRTTR